MTLRDAINDVLAICDDEDEREALLTALLPVLLDADPGLLVTSIARVWDSHADEIRAAIEQYHAEAAEIDAQIAADAPYEERDDG